MNNVSIILTTRNVFNYVKLAYESIRKYNPNIEIVLLDDASTDETIEWMNSLIDINLIKWKNETGKQLGHTITYNIGANISTKEIILIFHSDMVCSPNFIQNIIKHIKPKTIASGTRIEPPLYPGDDSKISKNFGIYIEEFKEKEFLFFVKQKEIENKNLITKGFFAPWAMYKNEYLKIGGMDFLFRPFPAEDSDFINRLYLDGYDIIQSRDSFCYHWCSRSHRWTTGRVNIDTTEFKKYQFKSFKNFLRKWGSNPVNNSFSYPIVNKKYDIGFVINFDDTLYKTQYDIQNFIKDSNDDMSDFLIGWFECLSSTIYVDLSNNIIQKYIDKEQNNTDFNLKRKIKNINEEKTNDIIVSFKISDIYKNIDINNSSPNDLKNYITPKLNILQNLSNIITGIITESGDIKEGECDVDIFHIEIKRIQTYEKNLIHLDDPYYTSQLL